MWIFFVLAFGVGPYYPGIVKDEYKFETRAACEQIHKVVKPLALDRHNVIVTQCRFKK